MMEVNICSTITDHLYSRGDGLTVQVEHQENDNVPIGIKVGCVDEWLTEDDVKVLVKVLSKALRIRKAALK